MLTGLSNAVVIKGHYILHIREKLPLCRVIAFKAMIFEDLQKAVYLVISRRSIYLSGSLAKKWMVVMLQELLEMFVWTV